jgi:hypothetical protein
MRCALDAIAAAAKPARRQAGRTAACRLHCSERPRTVAANGPRRPCASTGTTDSPPSAAAALHGAQQQPARSPRTLCHHWPALRLAYSVGNWRQTCAFTPVPSDTARQTELEPETVWRRRTNLWPLGWEKWWQGKSESRSLTMAVLVSLTAATPVRSSQTRLRRDHRTLGSSWPQLQRLVYSD